MHISSRYGGIKMIILKGVAKTYSSSYMGNMCALSDINLTFNDSEFVAITGRSGSGKTTLMNLIGGLDRPTLGEVIIDNTLLSSLTEVQSAKFRNEHIGFVFQAFYLEPKFSVLQNVALPLLIKGVAKKDREDCAKNILRTLGLEKMLLKKVSELSGGEMQRVAIARALVTNPKIILADEPTGNLDTENGKLVMDLLKSCVSSDRIVILVTHNEADVRYCNRIIKLCDGKVVEDERQ